MTVITLERARIHLNAWLDAELTVTKGQSYTIGNRTLTRANLSEITKQVERWETKVEQLASKGSSKRRTARFVPRDF